MLSSDVSVQDLEEWVSGHHGFVVFTLGSMVSDLPEDITAVFLDAFRQIPQKVEERLQNKVLTFWMKTWILHTTVGDLEVHRPGSWEHPEQREDDEMGASERPAWCVGALPETDHSKTEGQRFTCLFLLLAHRGARAFITHAGSHGVFEGLCHGVPMLMVPLNADQPDNALKIAQRGAGVVLDITSLTTESLLQGLREIINTTRWGAKESFLMECSVGKPPAAVSAFSMCVCVQVQRECAEAGSSS